MSGNIRVRAESDPKIVPAPVQRKKGCLDINFVHTIT